MSGSLWRNRGVIVVVALVALVACFRDRLLGSGPTVFGHDLQASQLVTPPMPSPGGKHAFLRLDSAGRPVRFDPCRTIHYVVRVGGGPLNGSLVVQEAVARLSEATGLHFAYDGTTDEVLADTHDQDVTDPVWIGWAEPSETTAYAQVASPSRDTVGIGGPTSALRPDGQEVYVTGSVVLRPSRALRSGFGPGESEGNVVLHELAHLVGLAHVDDVTQLMYPATGPMQANGYGSGDLEGLYEVGAAQGCL